MDAIAVTLNNIVSVSAFNKGEAGAIFSSVKKSGISKLVMRRNEPECVLVSPAEYSRIIAELEDLRDYKLATERLTASAGSAGKSFEAILAEEGTSFDELASVEDVEFE